MEKNSKIERPILNAEEDVVDERPHIKYQLMVGIYPGKPPFGYKNIPHSSRNSREWMKPVNERNYSGIEIDRPAAEIVKYIFDEFSKGNHTVITLYNHIKEKYPFSLVINSLHRILRMKFYVGIMTFNNKEYTHSHERIIDENIFNKVQQILSIQGNNLVLGKGNKGNYTTYKYRNLIGCYFCGNNMSGAGVVKSKTRRMTYCYYRCFKDKSQNIRESEIDLNISKIITKFYNKIVALDLGAPQFIEITKQIKYISDYFDRSHSREIVVLFFSRLIINGKDIEFKWNPLFDILYNDPEYLEYKVIKNDDLYLKNLIKVLYSWQKSENTVKAKLNLNHLPKSQKLIVDSCDNSLSFDDLRMRLNLSTEELQSNLIDLQLEGVIDEIAPGVWKALN